MKIARIFIVAAPLLALLALVSCGDSTVRSGAETAAGVVTTVGGDPDKVSYGEGSLPDNEFTKKLPKIEAGKFDGVVSSSDGVVFTLSEIKDADVDAFVSGLRVAGFTEDETDVISAGTRLFSAATKDNYEVALTYAENSMFVSVSKAD